MYENIVNLHKIDDVIMNEGNGGRRRIVGKNLAMRIDNIYNKLVDCILLSLHIDYNLGLIHLLMMVHQKIKIT